MNESMTTRETYQRFISWQCRLRKLSVRELGGQPSAGMTAGVHSVKGGEEQSRMNFMIQHFHASTRTTEFQHIIRKSRDPSDWVKNGLRILSEWHYQDATQFETELTGLFNLDSTLAEALITAGGCRLKIAEDSIAHEFDFDVAALPSQHDHFQATYWHNHLFNSAMPGQVQVLQFTPRL